MNNTFSYSIGNYNIMHFFLRMTYVNKIDKYLHAMFESNESLMFSL